MAWQLFVVRQWSVQSQKRAVVITEGKVSSEAMVSTKAGARLRSVFSWETMVIRKAVVSSSLHIYNFPCFFSPYLTGSSTYGRPVLGAACILFVKWPKGRCFETPVIRNAPKKTVLWQFCSLTEPRTECYLACRI